MPWRRLNFLPSHSHLTSPGMTQSEYRRRLEAGERKQVLRAKKERKLSDASQLDFDHGQILQMHFG